MISGTVKVHVPESDPAPQANAGQPSAQEALPARTTTYSNAYYEALRIPVAAELDP